MLFSQLEERIDDRRVLDLLCQCERGNDGLFRPAWALTYSLKVGVFGERIMLHLALIFAAIVSLSAPAPSTRAVADTF